MKYYVLLYIFLAQGNPQYDYGPEIVNNILVSESKLANEKTIKSTLSSKSKDKKKSCHILSDYHEIEEGTGTVIASRRFMGYARGYPESGFFLKTSLYIPYALKGDQGTITFNVKEATGFISSGGVTVCGGAARCYAYVSSGTMTYRRLMYDNVYIEYNLQIIPNTMPANDLLECTSNEISYSGYFRLKKVDELSLWDGKTGGNYFNTAQPNTGFRLR